MGIQKRQRSSGTRWVVRWREGGRQHSRTFFRRSDAELFDGEVKRRLSLGAFAPPEPSRQTLGEWLPVWFERGVRRWAASTIANRHSCIGNWIDPYLLEVRLRDLGSARIRDWQQQIRDDGASAQMANHALRLLSSALGAAVKDGLLPYNPASGVEKFPADKPRPRVLTPDQIERIRAAMPRLRDRVLVGLMAYAGLRPEEAYALRWGDVGNVLVVDRAFTHGELRTTKTNRRRTVRIIEPLAEDLDALRPRLVDVEALVCPSEAGTFIDHRNWRPRVWDPACQAAEVKAKPYDCRHAYASLMIHSGESIIAVAAAMGHASATTTMDTYAHVVDDARLAPRVSIVDEVRRARRVHGAQGVRHLCSGEPVRVAFRRASNERNRPRAGGPPEPMSGLEPLTPSLRVKCSTS